jgi:hypothetical protein
MGCRYLDESSPDSVKALARPRGRSEKVILARVLSPSEEDARFQLPVVLGKLPGLGGQIIS